MRECATLPERSARTDEQPRLQSTEPLLAGVPVIIMTAEHYQPELMAPTVRAFMEKPIALSVVL